MQARVPHRVRVLLTTVLLLLPGSEAVRAEVLPGELAPDIPGSEQVPLDARGLRGAFTLVEFFRTGCPLCQKEVPVVNALADRYRARGLRVVAVAYEQTDAVQAFVRRYGVRVPVVLGGLDALRDYGVRHLPRCYLVDPSGRVTWVGAPSALKPHELDPILAAAPTLPDVPSALAWARELLQREAYADLDARLAAHAQRGEAPPEASSAAQRIRAWIAWYGRVALQAAEMDALAGRAHDAWRTYRHLSTAYAPTPVGREAAARGTALVEDAAARREVEAGEALRETRDRAQEVGKAAALELFRAVASRYPTTRAGERARIFVTDLEKAVGPTSRHNR